MTTRSWHQGDLLKRPSGRVCKFTGQVGGKLCFECGLEDEIAVSPIEAHIAWLEQCASENVFELATLLGRASSLQEEIHANKKAGDELEKNLKEWRTNLR